MKERGHLSPTQQKAIIAILVVFLVSIYFLRSVYIPIFIAYFFAFLLNPVVRWFEKRGFGRLGPIFLMLVLVFALLLSFAVVMVPRIFVQIRELFQRLPLLMDFLSGRLGPFSMR